MNQKFGLFIVLGLVTGSAFGLMLGVANEKQILSTAVGALGGIFLGWFIAVIDLERENTINEIDKRRIP